MSIWWSLQNAGLEFHGESCHYMRMSWPEDHSLKRFGARVARMILLAEIIVLSSHFFDAPYRQHPWNGIGRAILVALLLGLVLGIGGYFLDRQIAIEDRKPNML